MSEKIIVDGQELDEKTEQQFLRELLFSQVKNKRDLDMYLRSVFGVYLASKAIDEGNSSPLDFVWDVISTMLGINPNPCFNVMAMAGRGTQKSLSGGVLEAYMLIHDSVRDWFHCAAIMDQSERTYQYVQRFFSNQWMSAAIDGEPLMKKTTSIHGTYLQIGTGTIKSVSGFHGSVVLDEYDLMEKIVTKMAKGMLSAQQGHRPFMIYLSSRYFATGNVNDMDKKNSETKDFRMHKWGILEMTEKCPASWSGKKTKNLGYVNDEKLVAISETQYAELLTTEKADYVPYPMYENCLKCGIFSFCKGNLKKQVTRQENPYLEPLEETISKFKDNDVETFKSQRLNRKGSSKDLVYSMWTDSVHVLSINEIWEMIFGDPCPEPEPTKEWLIAQLAKAGLTFLYSADPGFGICAAALSVEDEMGRLIVIDEITEHGLSEGEFALLIWEKWGHLPLEEGYPDQIPTFMKDLKREIRDADGKITKGSLPVCTKVDKSNGSVKLGIETFRKMLRIPGTMNRSRFFVLETCVQIRFMIENYRRKIDPKTDEPTDEPIKRNDHHPDHLRYLIHTRFSRDGDAALRYAKPKNNKHEIDSIEAAKKEPFNPNLALRAPTASELAQAIGVSNFNPTSSKDHNKTKKKSKLNYSF